MTRPLRVHIPHAFYHVMSRGNAKQAIFVERYAVRPGLEGMLTDCPDIESRYRLMAEAYWRYGYTLREIGQFLGCHVSTVLKQIRRAESATTRSTHDQGE